MTPLLPVIVPFGAAAISLALGRRHALRRSLGVLALVANLVASVLLLQEVRDGSVVTVVVGDWPAPTVILGRGPVLGDHAVGRLADALLAVFVYAIGSSRTDDTTLLLPPRLPVARLGRVGFVRHRGPLQPVPWRSR